MAAHLQPITVSLRERRSFHSIQYVEHSEGDGDAAYSPQNGSSQSGSQRSYGSGQCKSWIKIRNPNSPEYMGALGCDGGPQGTGHFAGVGVCMAITLLSASAHASAIAGFGDVEPGGVAKQVS
jgi:hypothetical protein